MQFVGANSVENSRQCNVVYSLRYLEYASFSTNNYRQVPFFLYFIEFINPNGILLKKIMYR